MAPLKTVSVVSPRHSIFHEAEAQNIEVEGKQNSLFTEGPVINCFVIPPDKYRKYCEKIISLTPVHTVWLRLAKQTAVKTELYIRL